MQIQSPNSISIPLGTQIKEEPSKWWAWSLAIIILIWSLFSALGAAGNYYFANSGFIDEIVSEAQKEIGPYPDNGSSFEQNEWNETNDFLKLLEDDLTSLYNPSLQLQFSLIVLLAGFIASFLLFSRDPNGFKAAGVWLGLVAITGTISQIITLRNMGDFYEEIPGIDSSLMTGIATGFSIGASLTCYLTVFAFIYVAAKRSSDKEENIVESGFHKV